MKKILKLISVVLVISCGIHVGNTEQDYSINYCNYNLLSDYFKHDNEELISLVSQEELPYNCTYQEVEADPEFKCKYYYFMKKSFHALKEYDKDNKITNEFFNSTENERDLIMDTLIATEINKLSAPDSSGLPEWYKSEYVYDIITQ